MEKKRWFWILGVLALLLIWYRSNLFVHAEAASGDQAKSDFPVEEQILGATISIIMYKFIPTHTPQLPVDPNGVSLEAGERKSMSLAAHGLGTLVYSGEELVIITHDHWRLLAEFDRVEFRSFRDELLVTMAEMEFRSLIRHRDGATMILKAPDEIVSSSRLGLPAPARLGKTSEVEAGAILYGVHLDSGESGAGGILKMLVDSIDISSGNLVLTLENLSGRSVVPGDSGGGIWFNGGLVGNQWMTGRMIKKMEFAPRSRIFHKLVEIDVDIILAAGLPQLPY